MIRLRKIGAVVILLLATPFSVAHADPKKAPSPKIPPGSNVIVPIPAGWKLAGTGTSILYNVPPQFIVDDEPFSSLNFPNSEQHGLFGFLAKLPSTKCPKWNRAEFAIDYVSQPVDGDGLQGFAEQITKVMFNQNNSSNVNVGQAIPLMINGMPSIKVDAYARAAKPIYCGAPAEHLSFYKVGSQDVFMAFRDEGGPGSINENIINSVLLTVRSDLAPIRYVKAPPVNISFARPPAEKPGSKQTVSKPGAKPPVGKPGAKPPVGKQPMEPRIPSPQLVPGKPGVKQPLPPRIPAPQIAPGKPGPKPPLRRSPGEPNIPMPPLAPAK